MQVSKPSSIIEENTILVVTAPRLACPLFTMTEQ